jgi:hypothetical protein
LTDFVCNDDGLMWLLALTAEAEQLVLNQVYRLYISIILYYLTIAIFKIKSQSGGKISRQSRNISGVFLNGIRR